MMTKLRLKTRLEQMHAMIAMDMDKEEHNKVL